MVGLRPVGMALGILAALGASDLPRPLPVSPGPGAVVDGPGPAPAPRHPEGLTLADWERLAWRHHPALASSRARIAAAEGQLIQGTRYPNPEFNFDPPEDLATGGSPGAFGAFIDQEFVIPRKLQLDRARFEQQVAEARWQAVEQQYRVLNRVRARFFELLAANRIANHWAEQLRRSITVLQKAEELAEQGQVQRADLLRARSAVDRSRLTWLDAQRRLGDLRHELASEVGRPDLADVPVIGDLTGQSMLLAQPANSETLLRTSPELMAARARFRHDQFALQRQQAQWVPNPLLRFGAGHDFQDENTDAILRLSVDIPLFDRNQGNIQKAKSERFLSKRSIDHLSQDLQRRLAQIWARYRHLQDVEQTFRQRLVPQAVEALALDWQALRQGEVEPGTVLSALEAYREALEDHTKALLDLRQTEIALRGFLLMDDN